MFYILARNFKHCAISSGLIRKIKFYDIILWIWDFKIDLTAMYADADVKLIHVMFLFYVPIYGVNEGYEGTRLSR